MGLDTTYSVSATGNPAVTYQWQMSTNAGASWTDLTNSSPYGGVRATTLTISSVTLEMSGARYRCVTTNEVGSATSASATLTVTIQNTAPMPSSLVVDFGSTYGLWIRVGTTWRQLNPRTSEGFISVPDGKQDGLVIDFGPGVGLWFWEKEEDGDEFWLQLTTDSPTAMVGVDFDGDGEVEAGVFTFPGQGLWLYDADHDEWSQLHPSMPRAWPPPISTVTAGRT